MKPRTSNFLHNVVRAALACGLALASPVSCSLGNLAHDACSTDGECAAAFGVGSACNEGYCSEPGTCTTGHDCRTQYGGGACVEGACQLFVPEDPACTIVEPPDLLSRPLAGDGAVLVVGAIFAREDKKNEATADAVRLAIQEINESTGVANGQSIGLVVCDNGGAQNKAEGDERKALDQHALDYLAGTLGAPFIVGPRTSSDALHVVARLVEKKYPTVVISPSATSPGLTGVQSRIDASDPQPLFWRTCPSDALQGKVLATELVGKDQAIATASVVYTNDAYGQGLSDVFLKEYGAAKTSLVPFDASKLASGGATAAAAAVTTNASDAIVIVAVSASHTIELLTAMAAAGLEAKKFFFTDGSKDAALLLDPELPTQIKEIISAAQGTAPASARDAVTFKQFTASLGAAFPGVDPAQTSFLAHAYDAAYLGAFGLVYAATKADGYDGRDVAEGLARLQAGTAVEVGAIAWPGAKQMLADKGQIDVLGISGDLTLDPTLGEGPAPIEIWGVQGGTSFFTVNTIP